MGVRMTIPAGTVIHIGPGISAGPTQSDVDVICNELNAGQLRNVCKARREGEVEEIPDSAMDQRLAEVRATEARITEQNRQLSAKLDQVLAGMTKPGPVVPEPMPAPRQAGQAAFDKALAEGKSTEEAGEIARKAEAEAEEQARAGDGERRTKPKR